MKFHTRIIFLFVSTYALYGVLIPFAPIVLRDQGLSDRETNIALSSLGFAALLSPILISHLADRSYSLRQIIVSLLAINALLSPLWIYVRSVGTTALLTLFYYATVIPVMTLLEAYTVNHVITSKKSNPRAREYQSYRIWGSIGFILPSLILIRAARWYPINTAILGTLSLILGLISITLSLGLPAERPEAPSAAPSKQAIIASLRPPLRGIFAATTIAGLSLSIFYLVFPRYLQELGNSTEWVGIIINIGVLAEILCMPLSNWLIKQFGARTLVLAALWAIAVRLLLITGWPTTTMVVATQVLHAPLIIGLFVSIPLFLGEFARDSFRYSLQGLNTALVVGFSRLIGPWFSAAILDNNTALPFEGLRQALLFAAALGGLAFLVLFFSSSQIRTPRISKETSTA